MAVAFKAVGTLATDSTGQPAVPYPAGIAVGDLLIIQFASQNTVTPTTPSGWTKLFGPYTFAGTAVKVGYVFWKIASGSETGTLTIVNTGSSIHAGAIMICYSGADATTPINTHATANNVTSGTTGTTPSVTTTVANTMLLRIYWDWSSSVTITPAGTDTERYDTFWTPGNTAFELADSTQAAAGASGTTTATFSGAASGGMVATIAVAPTAGPPPSTFVPQIMVVT